MPHSSAVPIAGRGTRTSPPNRFERLAYELDEDGVDPDWDDSDDEPAPLATKYYRDATRTIIATNQSPDIGFDASINPYRGCEHGCVYCYARPTHEYLGLSSGLDFESRIFVKTDAPALLRAELGARSWQPQVIAISGVTDAYQPIERHVTLTRRCLEVLAECRNPCAVITKNRLVARDADVLSDLAQYDAAAVFLSVTTLDPDLARRMEPRASSPRRRLEAMKILADAGVPVGVMAAPMIVGLNDHELPKILEAAADHGAEMAGYTVLRLPHGVGDLFSTWLDDHYPLRRDRVLGQIRGTRGGRLNESAFHERMRGSGPYAAHLAALFKVTARRLGLSGRRELSHAHFRRPADTAQPGLFAMD